MNYSCKQCFSMFEMTESDLAFLDKVSPSFNGVKCSIPAPTLCPDCRLQRRLSFWNCAHLYKRKCARTGKDILSIYSEDKPYTVYDQKEWWKDDWDALSYGRDFDFSRSFFDQFAELQRAVPRMALMQSQNENSDYTNYVSQLKDCYLLFASDFNRDCCYGLWVENSKDCFDNYMIDGCEQAYECFFSTNIYASSFVYFSSQCSGSSFLIDCRNCQDCFMCWGLRTKQYCIENVQYTKEAYEEKMKEYSLKSYKNLQQYKEFFLQKLKTVIHPSMRKNGRIIESSGNLLVDVENCLDCYEVTGGKDCKRVLGAVNPKDLQDCSYVGLGELAYECCECFPIPFQSAFNINSYTGSNLLYCDGCMNNCRDLFGCVSLKQKQYCILNKQYTKEEYEMLVPKIIEHMKKPLVVDRLSNIGEVNSNNDDKRQTINVPEWGEFFPLTLSFFAYNETEAQNCFPLREEEVLQRGWKWMDASTAETRLIVSVQEIPDSISDVSDDICKQILQCEISGKPYKIIPQELKFYRTMGLPIPRKCFNQRHAERVALRNPRKLWDRECAKCFKGMKTTYGPGRTEVVYCEECYLESVY